MNRGVWEVWVSNLTLYDAICGCGEMRFNALFRDLDRAIAEKAWYQVRGYLVELR